MPAPERRTARPSWRARRTRIHHGYTVVVFILLASLDNVAIGLAPPLYSTIADDMAVRETAIGLVTATNFLVTAVAAVGWAYLGDRGDRKPLLISGTLVWAVGTGATALADGYLAFFASQIFASVGLGTVASVGFSVISDLISPHRRGLVMSFWGLSQGAGTLAGTLTGGLLGAGNWRLPFATLAIVGVAATVAYLFTATIRRGQSEPELAGVFAGGGEYRARIVRSDLPVILGRRSNTWLILQGLTAQIAFGSLVWLPRLFQAKIEDQGYDRPTAIAVGAVFATLFQLGAALSVVGGLVGDRLARRTPRGRALVAAVGVSTAVPFYLLLFFLPMTVSVPDSATGIRLIGAVLVSVATAPSMTISFVLALIALALTSANSPNWFALIADVNPPEHRGTVYSLGNLVNGVGRASGNWLVAVVFGKLSGLLAPPLNFAAGLAVFQLFFLPTGAMYYAASRHTARDRATVRALLTTRAGRAAGAEPVEPGAPRGALSGEAVV